MNQEIIRDFWNLPKVVGVTIIHGLAEPYFCIKEQVLNWEKQALKQSSLQIVAKTPRKFEFFDFQVMGYHAYTYRLNPNLTLLFLTRTDIDATEALAANQLKAALQEDVGRVITMFELLTRKIPQPRAVSIAVSRESHKLGDNANAPLKVKVTIEELLNALNHLSQFSSNYMGGKLAANYWQLARPKVDWLNNFQINQSAKITFSGKITEPVSTLQHQWVKEWTAAFIKRCSQIIQDLPTMIEKKGLDEQKKRLLLTLPDG
jgi:hypothetical protein